MKGASGGAAAPGDYVYFKSVVPLHKISVSLRAPPTPSLPCPMSPFSSPPRPGFMGTGTLRQALRLVRSLVVGAARWCRCSLSDLGWILSEFSVKSSICSATPSERDGWLGFGVWQTHLQWFRFIIVVLFIETVALPKSDDTLTEIAIFMLNLAFRCIVVGISAHCKVILVWS